MISGLILYDAISLTALIGTVVADGSAGISTETAK